MSKGKMKGLAAAGVLAGSLVTCASPAGAATVTINPGDSLQAALVAAGVGGTVVLNCGVWSSLQAVDGLNLKDASHPFATVKSADMATRCAVFTDRVRVKNTQGLKFEAVTLRPTGNLPGMYVESGTTIRLSWSYVQLQNQDRTGSAAKGVQVQSGSGVSDFAINDNKFTSVALDGVYIGGGSNIDVMRNTFSRGVVSDDGVHRDFVQVSAGNDVVVYDNVMTGPGLGSASVHPNQGVLVQSTAVPAAVNGFAVYGNTVEHLDGTAYTVSGVGVDGGSVTGNGYCHVRGGVAGPAGATGVVFSGNVGTTTSPETC